MDRLVCNSQNASRLACFGKATNNRMTGQRFVNDLLNPCHTNDSPARRYQAVAIRPANCYIKRVKRRWITYSRFTLEGKSRFSGKSSKYLINLGKVAPRDGFEPPAKRLTVAMSDCCFSAVYQGFSYIW